MRSFTIREFTFEIKKFCQQLSGEMSLDMTAGFSKYDDKSFVVGVVDDQGRAVSPVSCVSVRFSYGSTGKLLVSTDGSRRSKPNDQSLMTAKCKIRIMAQKCANSCA